MRKHFLLAGAAVLLVMSEPAQPSPSAENCSTKTIQQLRIYEIFEHNKQAFHDRFRDHAARIMKRHGFEIETMWETRHGNRTEFVYLLRWPS